MVSLLHNFIDYPAYLSCEKTHAIHFFKMVINICSRHITTINLYYLIFYIWDVTQILRNNLRLKSTLSISRDIKFHFSILIISISRVICIIISFIFGVSKGLIHFSIQHKRHHIPKHIFHNRLCVSNVLNIIFLKIFSTKGLTFLTFLLIQKPS